MKSLPEGLIATTGTLPKNLDGLDGLEVGDIAQLWRMYNTNPGIHTGITGHRLENFFWRVWGSEVLLATMSGSMFARLFRVIEEGEYAEGLKLRDLGDLGTINKPTVLINPATPERDKDKDIKKPTRPPLVPILKKQKSISAQSDIPKTTRLLLTSPEGQNFTRNPDHPPTPLPRPEPKMPNAELTPTKPKKPQSQAVFVATTMSKTPRRRPVVMRRKSSKTSVTTQASLGTAHSPEVSSPLAGEGWVDFDEGDDGNGNKGILSPVKEASVRDEKGSETPTPMDRTRQAHLPESFIANLKAQLKAHPPHRSLPRNLKLSAKTRPQANDPDLWYGWYRQPSKDKLIDGSFRSKFAEQVQDAKIASAQVIETGEFADDIDPKHRQPQDEYSISPTTIPPSYTPVYSFRGNNMNLNANTLLTPDSSGSCAILTTSSSAETQLLGSGPTRSSGSFSTSLYPTPSSGSNDATISVSGLSGFRDINSDVDADGDVERKERKGSGSIKMDVSFEELEELSPMVW